MFMKRGFIFLIILLCLSLLFAVPALADRSKTIAGITWSYTSADGLLEFSGEGELPKWSNTYKYFHWGNYDQDVRKIVINKGITQVANLGGYEHLSEVSIADTVTVIGDRAFAGSISLKEIEIPYGVTSIGYNAFGGCTSLAEITLPNSLTTIGNYAFAGTAFPAFSVPNSITELNGSAFSGCTSLEFFIVDPDSTSFTVVDGVLYSKDMKTLVRCPPARKGAFIIPDSVTTIGNSAFEGCKNLTEISIPDNVTAIEAHAFENCAGLTSVTIAPSMEIGTAAFAGSSLKSVTIQRSLSISTIEATPEGTFIDADGVFSGCKQLATVTIDKNVVTIGPHLFDECPIQDVYFGGAKSQVDTESCTSYGGYGTPDPGTTLTVYNKDYGNENLLAATWHYAMEDAPSEDQEQPPEDYTVDPFSQNLQHYDVETQNIYYNVSVNKWVMQNNEFRVLLRGVTKDADGNMKITVRKVLMGDSFILYSKEGVELTVGNGEPQRIENKLNVQLNASLVGDTDPEETFTVANPQDKDISLHFYFVWLDGNFLHEGDNITETEKTTVEGGVEFILPIHFIGDGFEEYKKAEMKILHVKNPADLPENKQICDISEMVYDQDGLTAFMYNYSCETDMEFYLAVDGEKNTDLAFFVTAVTVNGKKANYEPTIGLVGDSTGVIIYLSKWLFGTVPFDYQNPDAETDGVWPDRLESISFILNMHKTSTTETVARIPLLIYFDKTSESDPEAILPGDVDGNGEVDGRDVVRLMNWLAEEIDPETDERYEIHDDNADVNGDGIVDEKDLLRLVKYFGGEDVTLEPGNVSGNG